MNKLIKKFLLLSLFATTLFLACNKKETAKILTLENATEVLKVDKPKTRAAARSILNIGVTVSSQGFLIFDKVTDLERMIDFLDNSTHAEVQEYLTSLGFNSMGATKYEASSSKVAEEQRIDYVIDVHSMIQIEGIVMKSIQENKFLLTVISENLSEDIYNSLLIEKYNSNFMNKFSTFPENQLELPLIEFIKKMPNGFEQTNTFASRRFLGCGIEQTTVTHDFGYGIDATNQCVHTVNTCTQTDVYIFGWHISSSESGCTTTTTPSPANYCTPRGGPHT